MSPTGNVAATTVDDLLESFDVDVCKNSWSLAVDDWRRKAVCKVINESKAGSPINKGSQRSGHAGNIIRENHLQGKRAGSAPRRSKSEDIRARQFTATGEARLASASCIDSVYSGLPRGLSLKAGFWTPEECTDIEQEFETTRALACAGKLKPNTVDGTPHRTKYFFGYGYTYGAQVKTKGGEQLLHSDLVDPIPSWVHEKLILKIEEQGYAPRNWIDSAVMNDYQPTGMIMSHVDPPHLFARPIFICSFLATCRLAFGSGYDFDLHRGAATHPKLPQYLVHMSRGSLTIMDGYAANNISHGIRSVDLDGRRVSILLRHVLPDAPCLNSQVPLPPAQRGAKFDGFQAWLLDVDGGEGFLLDHLRTLSSRFHSPAAALQAYTKSSGGVGSKFFKELGIAKLGHRRLFMKWFNTHGIRSP